MAQSDRLTDLLESMPAIADAVNSFHAPEVQRAAFDALLGAATGQQPDSATVASNGNGAPNSTSVTTPNRTKKSKAKSSKKSKITAISMDDGLNLEPNGQVSFVEFADLKNPTSLTDKSIVCVYWLKHHSELERVGVSQVYTCYKRMGWQTPSNPSNQLQQLASKEKWLDTSSMEDIALTHAGVQHVEHGLPRATKKAES